MHGSKAVYTTSTSSGGYRAPQFQKIDNSHFDAMIGIANAIDLAANKLAASQSAGKREYIENVIRYVNILNPISPMYEARLERHMEEMEEAIKSNDYAAASRHARCARKLTDPATYVKVLANEIKLEAGQDAPDAVMDPEALIAQMKSYVVAMKALDAPDKLSAMKGMMMHDPVLSELFHEWKYRDNSKTRRPADSTVPHDPAGAASLIAIQPIC